MTAPAPKGLRLHIGIFGRRNAGKSSLLNALTRQEVSIVSATPGTTTDPVEKPMELLPLGPVLFIDTAGVDDIGALGELRVEKTKAVFDRTDLAILVVDAGEWTEYEKQLLGEFAARKTATIVVFNKSDLGKPAAGLLEELSGKKIPFVSTTASSGEGIAELKRFIIQTAPGDFLDSAIVSDLVGPGETAV